MKEKNNELIKVDKRKLKIDTSIWEDVSRMRKIYTTISYLMFGSGIWMIWLSFMDKNGLSYIGLILGVVEIGLSSLMGKSKLRWDKIQKKKGEKTQEFVGNVETQQQTTGVQPVEKK